ncbi:MAG: hypothetical protein IT560_11670 [Alphaproteobacteria bacterium]|nr:hypothetical protein [Alphaproteobacteria bacterium]
MTFPRAKIFALSLILSLSVSNISQACIVTHDRAGDIKTLLEQIHIDDKVAIAEVLDVEQLGELMPGTVFQQVTTYKVIHPVQNALAGEVYKTPPEEWIPCGEEPKRDEIRFIVYQDKKAALSLVLRYNNDLDWRTHPDVEFVRNQYSFNIDGVEKKNHAVQPPPISTWGVIVIALTVFIAWLFARTRFKRG